MLLAELLPTARWKLLRALWLDGASDSVRALALRNQLSYSSAHAELKRLERASFARSRVVGNALVFEADRDRSTAGAVEELVRASVNTGSAAKRPDSQHVMAALASLGAPVRVDATESTQLTAEEVVAHGLRLAHGDPTLARAYPVLLARNRNRLDLEVLKRRATALKEKQSLGFFAALTGELSNDRQLKAFAESLKDRRVKKVRDFFDGPHGKYSEALANQRTPPLARDWHFRMDMDMDNFGAFYAKFFEKR